VKRSGRTQLIAGRVVVLADPRRGEAILPQDRADGGTLRPDDGVISRVSGGHFGDHAEAYRVMVAARDQRCPRRRAESGWVELGVTKSGVCDAIHCRSWDDAAESPRYSIALIVGHDQEHIGRTLGRHHSGGPIWFRLAGLKINFTAELRWRRRKI